MLFKVNYKVSWYKTLSLLGGGRQLVGPSMAKGRAPNQKCNPRYKLCNRLLLLLLLQNSINGKVKKQETVHTANNNKNMNMFCLHSTYVTVSGFVLFKSKEHLQGISSSFSQRRAS